MRFRSSPGTNKKDNSALVRLTAFRKESKENEQEAIIRSYIRIEHLGRNSMQHKILSTKVLFI
jgi:hypothetical protein